jgi:phosphomevalonate kinase
VTKTLHGNPSVAAPGKLFLVGEYAVLDGGTAVVAAVNRYAIGEFVPALDAASPLVAEAVRRTLAALGDKGAALPAGSVWVQSGAFSAGGDPLSGGGVKLGIGSSAATSACAVGAILELAGTPVAAHRDLVFSVAESAHRAWQGGIGSGADVAAAVYGGIIQYARPGGGAPVVERLPGGLGTLELIVFSARKETSTVSQIQAVRALAERSPAPYSQLMGQLRDATERFLESMAVRNAGETILATRAAGLALAELGRAADTPIVTAPFERAAVLAAELGGAAKPSGAGGGDVGIALFPERAAAQAFVARAAEAELDVLDLRLEDIGVHRRGIGSTNDKRISIGPE